MAETRKQRDMPSDKVFTYTLRGILIGHDEDGDAVTSDRQCVTLKHWCEYCGHHSLTRGKGESSPRTAYSKVKASLQEKGGYLRGMVEKAGAGELHLERSFYGRLSGMAA